MDNESLFREGPQPEAPDTVVIEGVVRRVLFFNDSTGWAAVRIETEDKRSVTAVGTLFGLQPNDQVRLNGRWAYHDRYGEQLAVSSFLHIHPTTSEGIRRFLASGRFRGVGPVMAKRLVDHFGVGTLDVLEGQPARLTEVSGIGPATASKIRDGWRASRSVQEIMVFLHGHGISASVAAKVHSRYGPAALSVVRENPYRLADEIIGVGFRTADRVARELGIPQDSPERARAGLLYVLQEATAEGHVFLPQDRLLYDASALLEVDGTRLSPALEELGNQGRVRLESEEDTVRVFLPRLHDAEAGVAVRLQELATTEPAAAEVDIGRALAWYERDARLRLSSDQRRALAAGLAEKLIVITGGPGTGKTTLIRGLTRIFGMKGLQIELAAPTGRAAKRLKEATGLPARTIHRLLEYAPASHSFSRCRENPLECDLLVLDEASMLDIELAYSLLEAVPGKCRLVLVGDADQLPSVGPGNVLRDLISSHTMPVMRLEKIFRQAQQSLIVVNAHRVNHGEMPVLKEDSELTDFYFVARDDPAAALETVIELVTGRIPDRFSIDPLREIQVLSPMHRGVLGVAALNERLRQVLNPSGPELKVGSRLFRTGDKVMQVRNNYELDLFNGDLGTLFSIDVEQRSVLAHFDGRPVGIPSEGLDDLVPAYACTIHKSQGSEYPAVVILLHHQHHIMLQRNLLYTAITRGKRLVVIVGSRRALSRAVRNATERQRHTALADRLRSHLA
ncbi:MAG: ATP-dependent RecD-like DNA helicase [Acidobacteria bacterium]|nr:ATP-dependent RecD-like DNA helicase [Acidobacteriota bacterium]